MEFNIEITPASAGLDQAPIVFPPLPLAPSSVSTSSLRVIPTQSPRLRSARRRSRRHLKSPNRPLPVPTLEKDSPQSRSSSFLTSRDSPSISRIIHSRTNSRLVSSGSTKNPPIIRILPATPSPAPTTSSPKRLLPLPSHHLRPYRPPNGRDSLKVSKSIEDFFAEEAREDQILFERPIWVSLRPSTLPHSPPYISVKFINAERSRERRSNGKPAISSSGSVSPPPSPYLRVHRVRPQPVRRTKRGKKGKRVRHIRMRSFDIQSQMMSSFSLSELQGVGVEEETNKNPTSPSTSSTNMNTIPTTTPNLLTQLVDDFAVNFLGAPPSATITHSHSHSQRPSHNTLPPLPTPISTNIVNDDDDNEEDETDVMESSREKLYLLREKLLGVDEEKIGMGRGKRRKGGRRSRGRGRGSVTRRRRTVAGGGGASDAADKKCVVM